MESSSAKTSQISINPSDTLNLTDSTKCIISLQNISVRGTIPSIEMYINEIKFMKSTSELLLNVSTINVETGMFKTLVVTYDKIDNIILTNSSVNLISVCDATIFIPETKVRIMIPTNGVLIIPSGCIIKSKLFDEHISKELSILSQSQLITKWLKSLISSDMYKKVGNTEIRNKIITLVEVNALQIEEIYNLIKKPNKLELAIFKNIREIILQMRVELVVSPLPKLILNPDTAISNSTTETVQKSDTTNKQVCKKRKIERL